MSRRSRTVSASWRPWILLFGLLPLLFWSVASPVAHTHGAAYGSGSQTVSCHGHPVQAVDGLHHCLACDWESISSNWQALPVVAVVLVRPVHQPEVGLIARLSSAPVAASAARGPPAA